MFKSPWFTLILGLLIGFLLGYVFGESQQVQRPDAQPPAKPAELPQGHPPVDTASMPAPAGPSPQVVASQVAELEQMLANDPANARIMVALGNLHFDASQWPNAVTWYERSLAIAPNDPDVMTDLAAAHNALGQYERAIELLDRVIAGHPRQWQAWYNKAVVLSSGLGRHVEARWALDQLEELRKSNDKIPDSAGLAAAIDRAIEAERAAEAE